MRSDESTVGTTTVAVPARAALAGNPSDGHGGAVTAVPLRCWTARATVGDIRHHGPTDLDPDVLGLVEATHRAMVRLLDAPADLLETTSVAVQTTVPRSVGLAGSSAIVIAVARALALHHGGAEWTRPLGDPRSMAVVARSAEVDELGIAAGLQDRLVQAAGEPLLMEFGPDRVDDVLGMPCGSIEPVPSPAGALLVASRSASAEPSGVVHAGLATRTDTGPIMSALAVAARDAAAALRSNDPGALGTAMDRTFDLRAELLELDPRHVDMVVAAREAGAHANYTGSGGAVIVAGAVDAVAAARQALTSIDGCEVVTDPLAPPRAADH